MILRGLGAVHATSSGRTVEGGADRVPGPFDRFEMLRLLPSCLGVAGQYLGSQRRSHQGDLVGQRPRGPDCDLVGGLRCAASRPGSSLSPGHLELNPYGRDGHNVATVWRIGAMAGR